MHGFQLVSSNTHLAGQFSGIKCDALNMLVGGFVLGLHHDREGFDDTEVQAGCFAIVLEPERGVVAYQVQDGNCRHQPNLPSPAKHTDPDKDSHPDENQNTVDVQFGPSQSVDDTLHVAQGLLLSGVWSGKLRSIEYSNDFRVLGVDGGVPATVCRPSQEVDDRLSQFRISRAGFRAASAC